MAAFVVKLWLGKQTTMHHVNTTVVCASALNKFYLRTHISRCEMQKFLPCPEAMVKMVRRFGWEWEKLHVCDFHRLQVYSVLATASVSAATFPAFSPGKTVLLISVGHRLGRMGKPALCAGIRGYLSQIVELSSSMPIYVLALTWLTYFNDFICQSAVHFSVRQGVCSIFALRLK